MAAYKSSQFRKEATRAKFEVELEDGTVVTFRDVNKLPTASAFDIATMPPKDIFKTLLGDDFDPFWAEFGDRPQDETMAVLEAAMTHYGANPK